MILPWLEDYENNPTDDEIRLQDPITIDRLLLDLKEREQTNLPIDCLQSVIDFFFPRQPRYEQLVISIFTQALADHNKELICLLASHQPIIKAIDSIVEKLIDDNNLIAIELLLSFFDIPSVFAIHNIDSFQLLELLTRQEVAEELLLQVIDDDNDNSLKLLLDRTTLSNIGGTEISYFLYAISRRSHRCIVLLLSRGFGNNEEIAHLGSPDSCIRFDTEIIRIAPKFDRLTRRHDCSLLDQIGDETIKKRYWESLSEQERLRIPYQLL